MSGKPVVLRERARRDIDEAVEHYLAEAGEAVALDFIDALEDARRRIGEQPAIGFFTIVGHGVPDVVVRDARDLAYEFFALPLAEKMRIPRPGKVATRGYDPPANQRLAATHGNDTPPDLQEIFGMGEFDLPDDPYYTEGYGDYLFEKVLSSRLAEEAAS